MTNAPNSNHPQIEMAARTSLFVNPDHPRKHPPKQVGQIANSIDRFGFLVPIVAQENGLIIAGVGRWLAAELLGMQQVPTLRASFMSDADRRAFVLADAKLAEGADWDVLQLQTELQFLFEAEYDIDITGFGLRDLDFMVVGNGDAEAPVELPNPSDRAVSRLGDLWRIGPHRLLCGNARDSVSFESLLGADRAVCILSDPPFNVRIIGHVSGLGKHEHREFAEASGEMTSAEFTTFLRTVFRNCVRFSINGSIHSHFMDWRHMSEILDAAAGVYTELKQLAVWDKGQGGMGAFLRSQHELVFIFKSGKKPHINNVALGKYGRNRSNIWTHPGANTFRKGRDEDLAAHPTVKPVALLIDAILDVTNRGDLVLDPFSGSASLLCAAHLAGRHGAAIEIDPLYVDTGLRRLAAVSGLTPILSDGRTFDEVKRDRLEGQDNA